MAVSGCYFVGSAMIEHSASSLRADGSGVAGPMTSSAKQRSADRDMGVKPDEGLALYEEHDVWPPGLFLKMQPHGTTGLARRLNRGAF